MINKGIDWRSILMDGCQTKVPLASSKRQEPNRQSKTRRKTQFVDG